MAQLPSVLRSQIDSYRESLSADIESSANIIENFLGGWGNENAFERAPFTIEAILSEIDELLITQKATFEESNRVVVDQGSIGSAEVPSKVEMIYDKTDYGQRILADANLDYTPQDSSKYTIPVFQSDTIVYEDIERLRLLELSDDAVNAIANDGIKNAQFEANANMDLASANLGSRGFRSVNSWLSAKHADEANKVTDLYYRQYRSAIEARYKFVSDNLALTTGFYPQLDNTAIESNKNVAEATARITKTLFDIQGIINDSEIDTFSMQKKATLSINTLTNKLDLVMLLTSAKKIKADFDAKYQGVGAAWKAELTRIENELIIETSAVGLDETARNLIISTGIAKADTFINACSTQLEFEVGICKEKAIGLKNKFDNIVSVATGATVSTIGIDRYK